ncbi:hypothetical protein [Nostoc sp.]|uniref:hypothetical protein n=1 Tax=Nostoc sp. TaxID=1180 RepID=UPI002FFCD9CC
MTKPSIRGNFKTCVYTVALRAGGCANGDEDSERLSLLGVTNMNIKLVQLNGTEILTTVSCELIV